MNRHKMRKKAIKCDCLKCIWAKSGNGYTYCKKKKINNPQKEMCDKYCTQNDLIDSKAIAALKSAPRNEQGNILAKDVTTYQPAFPWERKIE